jgi:hypothetical protein
MSDILAQNISSLTLTTGELKTNVFEASNLTTQSISNVGDITTATINCSSITTQYYSTSSFAFFTGDCLFSSILSAPRIFAGSLQSLTLNTDIITGSNLIFSTIQFPNANFLDLLDMRVRFLSTQVIYTSTFTTTNYEANNFLIGSTSNSGYLGFYGRSGNYTNSVLTELSTGTTSQEFLMFRGSSVIDQIRLQTTGSIVFETGVSARLYPNTPQIQTPTVIINSSSNVGIGIANPQTTLDVGGSFRALTASTIQTATSSLQVGTTLVPPNFWFGSTNYVSANVVASDTLNTTNLNAITVIAGSFKGDGSLLSNINVSTGLAIPVTYGSSISMSTGILRSGGLFLATSIV